MVPVAVERSRSGKGAHAWIFFSKTIPALMARRLGTFLLTETLDMRPEVGFDSYDRLFPSQDFLPEGGFGSLIALPLQGKSRKMGNTLFVDEDFNAYPDQWAFLSTIYRMSRQEIEDIVEKASRTGKIIGARLPVVEDKDEEPWRLLETQREKRQLIPGLLPKKINLVLGNLVYIDKKGLTSAFRNRLIHFAAFQNPEFYKAQAMRLSTYGKPRIISCAEDFPKYIGLPRGCLEEILEMCQSLGIEVSLRDERNRGIPIDVEFHGSLKSEQEKAVKALLEQDTGVLAAATAFGKTVVAARLIAKRAVNTLVLVHRRQLLDQWSFRLAEFLNLESKKIGQIGGGKRYITGTIDVAIIQSLWRKGKVDDIVGYYGHVVVDECHHISANSFEQVIRKSKAKYVTGLSATVTRKDGHHPIIFMQCGSVRYRVTARQGVTKHPFRHRVIFRETEYPFSQRLEERELTIHEIYDSLIDNEARNTIIFEDVMKCVAEENRSPLLISERREHIEMFATSFRPFIKNVIVFRGGMGKKQRQALYDQMAGIPDDEERLLIATGRYLGEGFDDARLDTLFLTLPISWRGTLAQYAGRLHRLHYNKKEVRIYDYTDLKIPLLAKMYKRRLRGYRSIGYSIG
jgi:superfamily II DNA or RNA helicase